MKFRRVNSDLSFKSPVFNHNFCSNQYFVLWLPIMVAFYAFCCVFFVFISCASTRKFQLLNRNTAIVPSKIERNTFKSLCFGKFLFINGNEPETHHFLSHCSKLRLNVWIQHWSWTQLNWQQSALLTKYGPLHSRLFLTSFMLSLSS